MLWLALGLAQAHEYTTWEVGSGEDWCAVVAQAASADLIQLSAGTYEGDCTITNGGRVDLNERTAVFGAEDGETVIRGQVTIEADLVRLFRATVDGVVTVRGDSPSLDGLTFREADSGIRVEGDHSGVLVFSNTFDGVDAALSVCAGCAAQGVARKNLLLGPGGTGLQVEGDWLVGDNTVAGYTTAIDARGAGTVTGNLVLGGAVGVVAEGSVAVTTNLVHQTTTAGIRASGARHNTVTPAAGTGLEGDGTANAVLGQAPAGNVGCEADCFVDLAGSVLLPAVGGPLHDGGDPAGFDKDFCGGAAVGLPDVGALEADHGVPGVLSAVPKAELCGDAWDPGPVDTGAHPAEGGADTGESRKPGRVRVQPGCGCASGSGRSVGPWWGLLLLLRRRRTRHPRRASTG